MDFFNPAVKMSPFPSPVSIMQYPYTTPIAQRPFPPLQAPIHGAFHSYSASSTYSPNPILALPGFEKPLVTDLIHASPAPIDHKDTPDPVDQGFGISRDDRRPSIIALTLAPLTCPKSTIHIVFSENGKIQKFPMHRDLLCFYSPYFRRLLTNSKTVKAQIRNKNHRREWRWEDRESVDVIMSESGEAEEKMDVDVVVKLPDDGVKEAKLDTEELGDVGRAVFAAFVNWLYHGYCGFGLFLPVDEHPHFGPVTLIQLWVFAGRIGVPECQNHCIEGIEWWRMTTNIIQTSMLGWVYENTMEYDEQDCPLRLLLIDQCAWKLDGNWLLGEMEGKSNEEQFPRRALVDLVSRMRVVLNENIVGPFFNSEMRKEAYWIDFENKSVSEVLEGMGRDKEKTT
jgi:hypothetical protein